MKNQFERSLSPLKIGSTTIRNRYCVGPIGGNFVYGARGEISEAGMQYYLERAKGGFGLIFSGAWFTDLETDPFSPKDDYSPFMSPPNFVRTAYNLNERLHAYGTKMFPQITMGLGRNYGLPSPSPLPAWFDPSVTSPELTKEQIKKKIEAMVKAAALMQSAGFAGVEVHAMHWGYLLDEFAMSIMNKRTDEYGGTLENRMRCAKEIAEGIKQTCGANFPITMRLGLKSYMKGFNQASLDGEEEVGRTLEEGVKICKLLEDFGYDALSVDVGIYDSFYHAAPPSYMPRGHVIEMSAEVKKVVGIPVLCGSRMGDPYMCEDALRAGKIDGMVFSRPPLADPHFPRKVEMGRPDKIRPCIGCNQGCINRSFTKGLDPSCAVNPAAGRELTYSLTKAMTPKKVVVVGGGVAGMELARAAKTRGHEVEIYEKSQTLGGHLISGGAHSFKKEVSELRDWYIQELKDLQIPVHLGTELDADMIRYLGADAVVLTTGSVPVAPKVPGMDDPKVVSSIDALLGKKPVGQKVAVIGGGLVGCEIALELAQEGKQVTVVEMLPATLAAGEPVSLMHSMMLNDLFAKYKVEVLTNTALDSVTAAGAVVAPAGGGAKKTVEADTVIIAVGFKSRPSMAQELYGNGFEVYEAGDGSKVGNILLAVWQAYEIARML